MFYLSVSFYTNKHLFLGAVKLFFTGALLKSENSSNNSIDIVFVINWSPIRNREQPLAKLVERCIKKKLGQGNITVRLNNAKVHKVISNAFSVTPQKYRQSTLLEHETEFRRLCIQEYKTYERDFPYFDEVASLRLGRIIVYRIRVECVCYELKNNQKCAKFLPAEQQRWAAYMGKNGSGMFKNKN